jgi:hypothetical protein
MGDLLKNKGEMAQGAWIASYLPNRLGNITQWMQSTGRLTFGISRPIAPRLLPKLKVV